MFRTTKITAATLTFLAVTTLGIGTAFAGAHWGMEVDIDLSARTAEGTMGTARASADGTQYIGCTVRATTGPDVVRVTCQARDAQGANLVCSSTRPVMIQAAAALQANSHLYFRAAPSTSECMTLHVDNFSYNDLVTP
ncbi:MAG: hypothetical protein U0234_17820 [Sandaracinus sp.]